MRDESGNTSTDTSSAELVIDTVAPAVPVVNALLSNDASPTLTGSVQAATGEELSVTLVGVTYTTASTPALSIDGAGNWQLPLAGEVVLADGVYEVEAVLTDAAGNTAIDSSSAELLIDTLAPAIPQVVATASASPTPVLTGSAVQTPGDVLSVSIDGITYTAGDGHLNGRPAVIGNW